MALWLAATIAHFVLTFFWVRALGTRDRDYDDLVFQAAVIGLGSFQAILHIVAFSVGLSLDRGLIALAATHLAVAAGFAIRRRRSPHPPAAGGEPRVTRTGPALALAVAGGVVVTAIAVQWALAASASLRVTGADAAHYHVPFAVNIALGANPFGLPATPHLYPMGTSVLAAWFILPLRDLLLVDLANLPPFLLAWCAVLNIVGETTGRRGIVYGPWCALAMFSAPLFRHSLLVSSDLFYAAAFLAVNALLLRASVRLRVERIDAVSLGLAVGMLVSTKVTGVFSAVALAGVYGAVILGRVRLERRRFECGVPLSWLGGAALLAVTSGGVWLIRSWWAFGSPLAPSGLAVLGVEIFPGDKYGDATYQLSVLGDLRGRVAYHLPSRLWYWVGEWLGAWFPVSALLVGLPVAAACTAWVRGRAIDDSLRTRLIFAGASAVLIFGHLVLLAGVPWSSLEWTDGFSLRYALPCVALLWLVACASVLPTLAGPGRLRWAAAFVLATVSIVWYVGHQGVPQAPPDEALGRVTLAGALLALALWVMSACVARLPRGVWQLAGGGMLVAAVSVGSGTHATRVDARLVWSAEIDLARHVARATPDGNDVSDFRKAYLELLAYEQAYGVKCAGRRVFTTSRWDFPLELESPRLENQVFDVRGPSFTPRLLERDRPGSLPCDYVTATRAALETSNGIPLVNWIEARGRLHRVAEAGPFVVLAAR